MRALSPATGGYVIEMRARALEFTAPEEARIVDVTVDEPQEGQIAVRTVYSGISTGSELLAFRGEIDPALALDETIEGLSGTFSYPFRYGYSCVGIVERSYSEIPSGATVFAFHPHQDRFVCDATDAVVLSGVDLRLATMFPLVETSFQISLEAADLAGESVVVMGLGSVGVLTSVLMKATGARVVGVDLLEARREVAAGFGIETVGPDEVEGRTAEIAGPEGVPLVIEASGDPAGLEASLQLLAHEGTVLVASWYGSKRVSLPLGAEFHRRRLTIRSTQVSSIPARLASRWTIERRRRHVSRLLAELPLKELATHEFPFEEASEAFALLSAKDGSVMHVALAYEEA